MTVRVSLVAAIAVAAACSTSSATPSGSPTPTVIPSASSSTAKTSSWDGVYTTAQAAHGATLFASTCNKCHGSAAAGSANDGGRLVGKEFFGLFENTTVDQVFTTIATMMPLDNPKSLAAKDVADITAYLLQQNQMPAGSTPLSENPDQLKMLKITATKP